MSTSQPSSTPWIENDINIPSMSNNHPLTIEMDSSASLSIQPLPSLSPIKKTPVVPPHIVPSDPSP